MKLQRGYLIRFWTAMTAYIVTLFASIYIIKAIPEDNPIRYIIAVIPVIPIIGLVGAILWWVRRMDEMQQRIQLEASVFSMSVTGILFFALGLLEAAGLKTLNMIWVAPAMIFFWGVGTAIAGRRYK